MAVMKEHKLELDHMSKLEKEELTRKKSNVVSEQQLDVVKSQLNDLSKPDFKKRIVNRVLRNLERATRDRLLSKLNDECVEDGKHLEVAKNMETESTILDPRTMYPIEYDVETEKLAVNGIEIIVDESEKAVNCSLCDFSMAYKNIKRFGNRAAEALVQDHIIGIHIGK
ncbi:unnamed protein product [Orchesella dallaii]|uniref:Uncharacterized protein n=1 Tax=Orchesella dallaii TaxID=48710 RepID=A0ABP1QF78_9HEXA